MPKGFGNLCIQRTASGDTPDYFCAESVDKIFLAEAKGRYTSVSFTNAEFASWRSQFNRVTVKDGAGHARNVKGYIVATRFATEERVGVKSSLFAEDPASPGDGELNEEERRAVGGMVMSAHYAEIAVKLNLPIIAAALGNGFLVPEELQFPVTVWEFQIPPLQGRRFVGGYYPSQGGALPVREMNGRVVFDVLEPLRLDVGHGTFFGVEEKIFRQVTAMARQGMLAAANVPRFEEIQPFYSAISVLRDGSIIGPIEFFRPVERIVL